MKPTHRLKVLEKDTTTSNNSNNIVPIYRIHDGDKYYKRNQTKFNS